MIDTTRIDSIAKSLVYFPHTKSSETYKQLLNHWSTGEVLAIESRMQHWKKIKEYEEASESETSIGLSPNLKRSISWNEK